jgi:hypothetical protein
MKSSPLAHPLLIEPGACFATQNRGVRQTLPMKTAVSPGMLCRPIVNPAHTSGDYKAAWKKQSFVFLG